MNGLAFDHMLSNDVFEDGVHLPSSISNLRTKPKHNELIL